MSSDAPETAARPLIRNLRLGLLTVAWGAALVTILSGQAHGFTATCGAAALGRAEEPRDRAAHLPDSHHDV